MVQLNYPKLVSSFSIFLSCLAFSLISHAATSAIDSALNSSLKESQDLTLSISRTLEHRKASNNPAKVVQKDRKIVQLNLDETDSENTMNEKASKSSSQASGDLIESSY